METQAIEGKQRNYCQVIHLAITEINFKYIVIKFKDIKCILKKSDLESNVFEMIRYENLDTVYEQKKKKQRTK